MVPKQIFKFFLSDWLCAIVFSTSARLLKKQTVLVNDKTRLIRFWHEQSIDPQIIRKNCLKEN